MKQSFIIIIPFTLLSLLFILTSAQSPAAAPAPGPTNLTAILEKSGRFTIFIRLLKSTKVADQIYTQLNGSNQGLTVFAPTDASFAAGLRPGALNSFSDEQKMDLMQFHVLPTLFSPSQFDTASNPLRTQAGGAQELFGMNVTATEDQVNITTGYTNASVANTIYTDNQLAVYEVDRVLLPRRFFEALPPSPPPPEKPEKAARSPRASPAANNVQVSSSGEICGCVVLVLAAGFQLLW
ncbi:fasciclin-like arabinogalactan protein 11 [Phtheirospermum japonicum]|uniref:Fasciclin-like arabinogalactan protein 11 n=1 Tax=Phtheirospermum japonicum TaxID=374723 RepID=A0A830BT07_9LAMI|nr:fasciclin-like arabinogalactan protein 11 [Phtheirospermum japonicum]